MIKHWTLFSFLLHKKFYFTDLFYESNQTLEDLVHPGFVIQLLYRAAGCLYTCAKPNPVVFTNFLLLFLFPPTPGV